LSEIIAGHGADAGFIGEVGIGADDGPEQEHEQECEPFPDPADAAAERMAWPPDAVGDTLKMGGNVRHVRSAILGQDSLVAGGNALAANTPMSGSSGRR
jgi:hypothetical protein